MSIRIVDSGSDVPAVPPKRLVFVCGVPRSGTSVFVRVLNGHPRVCLGMERYKQPLLRRAVDPGLFSEGRFFDFRPEDTNILPSRSHGWKRFYADLLGRWHQAVIVGDKVPLLFRNLDAIALSYPAAKYVYLLRGIEGVASSWNSRAMNTDDANWPARNDFREAVTTWNEGNRVALDWHHQRPKSMAVVSYERFFEGGGEQLSALCDFLRIRVHPQLVQRFAARTEEYKSSVRIKPPVVSEGQPEHIREHADSEAYESLLAVAL